MDAGNFHLCAALMHTIWNREPRNATAAATTPASIHLLDSIAMTAELPTVTGG